MILLSSFAQDLKLILIYWYCYPLPLEILTSCPKTILLFFSFRGLKLILITDTSILFRMSFEADLNLLILLSSSARGSKLILIYWYFYPFSHEVRSWFWNDDLLTWWDLHLIASLVGIWNSLKTSDCSDCLLSSRKSF